MPYDWKGLKQACVPQKQNCYVPNFVYPSQFIVLAAVYGLINIKKNYKKKKKRRRRGGPLATGFTSLSQLCISNSMTVT